MWPFEYVDNDGKVCLDGAKWGKFIEERSVEYPHNWNHRRALLTLAVPRNNMKDVPGYEGKISCVEKDFSVIFQPYPGHLRTGYDPDGTESWSLFIEDRHARPRLGEDVILFSAEQSFFHGRHFGGNWLLGEEIFRCAYFRGKYWRVATVNGGGYGPEPPPPHERIETPPERPSKLAFRNIDEDWET